MYVGRDSSKMIIKKNKKQLIISIIITHCYKKSYLLFQIKYQKKKKQGLWNGFGTALATMAFRSVFHLIWKKTLRLPTCEGNCNEKK